MATGTCLSNNARAPPPKQPGKSAVKTKRTAARPVRAVAVEECLPVDGGGTIHGEGEGGDEAQALRQACPTPTVTASRARRDRCDTSEPIPRRVVAEHFTRLHPPPPQRRDKCFSAAFRVFALASEASAALFLSQLRTTHYGQLTRYRSPRRRAPPDSFLALVGNRLASQPSDETPQRPAQVPGLRISASASGRSA